jgi:DNA-binding transcriptional MerR regulator
MNKEKYNVGFVARLSGLSTHTLRAWEKRYQGLSPARSHSGRRLYSPEEVERVKVLAELTRKGHSISQIVKFDYNELVSLLEKHESTLAPDNEVTIVENCPWYFKKHGERILKLVADFDLHGLREEVAWAKVAMSCRKFLFSVCHPLLREVGRRIDSGKMTIAQEHALSAILRPQLSEMYQVLQKVSESKVSIVIATATGDLHEFGILMGAILCSNYGIKTCYLGPNLPAVEIANVMKQTKSSILILGNTLVPPLERRVLFSDFIQELDTLLPESMEIWAGGNGDRPSTDLPSGRKFKYLTSLEELDVLLDKLARLDH